MKSAAVGLNGAERVVGSLRVLGGGDGVEQSGFAHVWQSDDTQFHIKYAPYTLGEHNNTAIIIRKGEGERKRQHSEKMFFTHKMNFACAAN